LLVLAGEENIPTKEMASGRGTSAFTLERT